MKGLLIAFFAVNGVTTAEMVTYNEIHSELAEDCAIEFESTDSIEGDACRRYFTFLDTSKDLRSINRQWLSEASLSAEQQAAVLHFVQRGNTAMSYIVERSRVLEDH